MTAADALAASLLTSDTRLLVEDDTSASVEAAGWSVSVYQDPITGAWVAQRRALLVVAVAEGRTADEAVAGLPPIRALGPTPPRERGPWSVL